MRMLISESLNVCKQMNFILSAARKFFRGLWIINSGEIIIKKNDAGHKIWLLPTPSFVHRCHKSKSVRNKKGQSYTQAMFTLYQIGFCSVSKVAPVQCEQELMFCCGAEIVPKRSQCEQKPYPLCNLQRSLLI